MPIRDQNRLETRLDAQFAQDGANVVANSLDRQAGTLRHRFEALIAETWHAVTVSDSGVRGRFYVAEAIRSIA